MKISLVPEVTPLVFLFFATSSTVFYISIEIQVKKIPIGCNSKLLTSLFEILVGVNIFLLQCWFHPISRQMYHFIRNSLHIQLNSCYWLLIFILSQSKETSCILFWSFACKGRYVLVVSNHLIVSFRRSRKLLSVSTYHARQMQSVTTIRNAYLLFRKQVSNTTVLCRHP